MCGFRDCLAILQWVTGGKATKYDGDEEDGELGPRPVGGAGDGKWDVSEKHDSTSGFAKS